MQSLGIATNLASLGNFTTAELIVATLPVISVPKETCQVLVRFFGALTPGTATTAITLRIREGASLTGTQINFVTLSDVTPGIGREFIIEAVDTLTLGAQFQWSLTGQGVASTGGNAVSNMVASVFFMQ